MDTHKHTNHSGRQTHTRTHTLSLSHTHTHRHTRTHRLCLVLPLMHAHSCSPSHSATHPFSISRTQNTQTLCEVRLFPTESVLRRFLGRSAHAHSRRVTRPNLSSPQLRTVARSIGPSHRFPRGSCCLGCSDVSQIVLAVSAFVFRFPSASSVVVQHVLQNVSFLCPEMML